jgi:hypothetical protein
MQNQLRGLTTGGLQEERNIMKQIIIRMFVALTMCGVTSLIRFTSFVVISPTPQVHTEAIWILRIILASVLSPLLYGFLDRRTSTWTIRPKQQRPSSKNSLNLTRHHRRSPYQKQV